MKINASSKSTSHSLAIIIEGGMVQAVVSTNPALLDHIDVMVIDYDTDGADMADVSIVPQNDGSTAPAHVKVHQVEHASINLNALKEV